PSERRPGNARYGPPAEPPRRGGGIAGRMGPALRRAPPRLGDGERGGVHDRRWGVGLGPRPRTDLGAAGVLVRAGLAGHIAHRGEPRPVDHAPACDQAGPPAGRAVDRLYPHGTDRPGDPAACLHSRTARAARPDRRYGVRQRAPLSELGLAAAGLPVLDGAGGLGGPPTRRGVTSQPTPGG